MTLENQLRDTFRRHGFPNASDLMDLTKFSNKKLRFMIDSWNNFPACMSHFPTILTPKNYPEI